MPELPEVETIVRGLAPHVEGKRIEGVEFRWARTCAGNVDATIENLRGQRIKKLDRHGKYIVFRLEKRRENSVLVIHLRMTGNLLVNAEPGPFTRAVMQLESGPLIVFHDIRKFGRWEWSRELPARLDELGPEPLEISADEFVARMKGRGSQLKALLLNQEFLRGLGNIYADEALFLARMHPKLRGAKLGRKRAKRLHAAIQEVLKNAIAAGGSTISNYVDSQGSQGYFQLQTNVYGKTGQPCKVCQTPLRRTIVASRSTHFCPRCQRR